MNKTVLYLLLTTLLFSSCDARNKTLPIGNISETLDKSNYVEDFQTFQAIFQKANAGLYRYHSKQEVDSVFLLNRKKINKNTTYRDFYNLVWNVVDYTGSCHNNLRYPDKLSNLVLKKKIFFPLSLKYIDGKLYSNSTSGNIRAGAEIISINEIEVDEFVSHISNFRSTDGFNQTAKYTSIQTIAMPSSIYKAYGEKDEFSIQFKHDEQIRSLIVKSVDYTTYKNNHQKRYSNTFEDETSRKFTYTHIDSMNISLLSVKSFAFGMDILD